MIKFFARNKTFLIFAFIALLMLTFWFVNYKGRIIDSDGEMYYRSFVNLVIKGDIAADGPIKYPIGTALLQSPFLFLGLLFSNILGISVEGGYSQVFQSCVFIAGVFYGLFGLFLVYRMIRKEYSDTTAVLTCFTLLFGTMLIEYLTRRVSFSHAYGFFTCSSFMTYVDSFEKKRIRGKYPIRYDIYFGLIFGLSYLIRSTNIIIGFVYLFYNVTSVRTFGKRLKAILFSHHIVIQIFAFIIPVFVQLLIWRIQFGHWVLNSYEGEEFNKLISPQIIKVLFSDAKGLFIYNPVLIFGVFGMILYPGRNRKYAISQWVIFIVLTYIVSSWWCWWLGTAYGERMYCDFLCVFAMPMACVFNQIEMVRMSEKLLCKDEKQQAPRDIGAVSFVLYIAIFAFVAVNLIMLHGVHLGIINQNMASWDELVQAVKHVFV